ncbi:MAG: ribonuclease P protein component [Tannerellaceae bacterium]|jgi:ribonuclease P protein component|nr:ribonuclease P protein component [Tannerellaceae bacterium]
MADKYSLPKGERLSWKRHIDLLFAKGQSFVAYPLRIVYLQTDIPMTSPVSMMISVPKKKIKKAVGRNRIKRQVREAYRLRKYELLQTRIEKNKPLLLAFLYLDKDILPTPTMDKAMDKAIRILRNKE